MQFAHTSLDYLKNVFFIIYIFFFQHKGKVRFSLLDLAILYDEVIFKYIFVIIPNKIILHLFFK